jgi:large subunit ribosomal protein L22
MGKDLVHAKFRRVPISPSRIVEVSKMLRGLEVEKAEEALRFQTSKGAAIMRKVLASAVANAVNNGKYIKSNLKVNDVKSGPAPTVKTRRFAAKGRFKPILKRRSNITLELAPIKSIKEAANE